MNFERHISTYLEEWRKETNRKPLVLRGARQVGKTTLIKEFSANYKNFILLNLEKPADRRLFEQYDDVETLVEALLFSSKIPYNEIDDTLLFIDEIQELPRAIQLLRYFYEERPALHVIAAGSLLEFAIKDVKSFPVGRIEYLYLHPLNFAEYLKALNHELASDQLHSIPVKPFAHDTLMDLFHRYAIVGGMPEVVRVDLIKNNLADLAKVYEGIWATYRDDVEKYTSNVSDRRVIKHVITEAHLYIDQRIKFQSFGNSNYGSREVGEAMRTLDDAKIIRLIYPTTDTESPLKSDLRKSPRFQFLDTGLVNHALGIQAQLLGMQDLSNSFKGAIIPHLFTQELISLNTITNKKPNFWVREKNQSSSEVDLVYPYKDKVIPIEIKSGAKGTLRSLHQFMDKVDHPYAIRVYGGKFKIEESKTNSGTPFLLMNLPYYLGTQLPSYIEYFIKKHRL